MADTPIVHIGENSPEQVAFVLLKIIADVEKRPLYVSSQQRETPPVDRKWLLDTYSECLDTVRGLRTVK